MLIYCLSIIIEKSAFGQNFAHIANMFAIHFAAKLLRFCSDFARECFFAANFAVVLTPGDFVRRDFCCDFAAKLLYVNAA